MNLTPYARFTRAKVYPYLFFGGNTSIGTATVDTDNPALGVPISFPTHNIEFVPAEPCDLFNVKSWLFQFAFDATGTGFVGAARSFSKTVNSGTYVYFDTATGLSEETFNGSGWTTQRERFEANWIIDPPPANQPPAGYETYQATVDYRWVESVGPGEEERVGCFMTVPLLSTALNAEDTSEIRHFYAFNPIRAFGWAEKYDFSISPTNPIESYSSPGIMFNGDEHMKVESHFTIEIDASTYY